jgi:quercetin dioxygenase-like cupin family protein
MNARLRIGALLICTALAAQESPSTSVLDLSKEPHHKVVFENPQVKALRLELQPGEETLPHRHQRPYAYLSLESVTIANEVRGRSPVVVELEAGEVHTSKGGFTLAERNKSSAAADLIVIEALKASTADFATPIGGFRYHDAAFGEVFQLPEMRAYSLVIAAGGRTEKHEERFDRLLVALSDLKLREDTADQPPNEIVMKAGEIKWFPRGMNHATTNTANSPASFITFEFQ